MGIMLKRFSVAGMRNFADEMTLDLSRTRDYRFNETCIKDGIVTTALMLGRNASGKSNFGRALMNIRENFLVRAPYPDDTLFLNADSDSGLARFSYVFLWDGHDVTYEYVKSSRFELASERLLLDGEIVFDFDNANGKLKTGKLRLVGAENLNWDFQDSFMSVASYITSSVPLPSASFLADVRNFAVGIYSVDTFRPGSPDEINSALKAVIDSGRLHDFEMFLARFGINESLKAFRRPDGTQVVYSQHGNRSIPFAEACSSGTQTLLKVFSNFELENPHPLPAPLAFYDEFDAYCHYELAEQLISYFAEKREVQTICTTHNASLVKNDFLRPDCVFLIKPGEGIKSLADSTDREIRLGNNVEKLLRSGEFE